MYNGFIFFITHFQLIISENMWMFVFVLTLFVAIMIAYNKYLSQYGIPVTQGMIFQSVLTVLVCMFALGSIISQDKIERMEYDDFAQKTQLSEQKQNSLCEARFNSGSRLSGPEDQCVNFYEEKAKQKKDQEEAKKKVQDINSQLK